MTDDPEKSLIARAIEAILPSRAPLIDVEAEEPAPPPARSSRFLTGPAFDPADTRSHIERRHA